MGVDELTKRKYIIERVLDKNTKQQQTDKQNQSYLKGLERLVEKKSGVRDIKGEKDFFIRKGPPAMSESVKRSKSYKDRRASTGSRNVETNGNTKGMAKHIWGNLLNACILEVRKVRVLRMTARFLWTELLVGSSSIHQDGEPRKSICWGEGKGKSSGLDILSMMYLCDIQVETSSGPSTLWV